MKTLKISTVLRIGILLSLPCGLARAETINIPIGQQHPELQSIAKPMRGHKMAQVLSKFGEPVQRYATRGTPPITRWEYPGYFVYFEHDHVIHSVLKHRPVVGAED